MAVMVVVSSRILSMRVGSQITDDTIAQDIAGLTAQGADTLLLEMAEKYKADTLTYGYDRLTTAVANHLGNLARASGNDEITLPATIAAHDDNKVRLFGFAVEASHYRRNLRYTRGRQFVDAMVDDFKDLDAYWHFRAMAYLEGASAVRRQGYEHAKRAVSGMPDNAGALHTKALYILDLIEAGEKPADATLDDGRRLVDDAIKLYDRRARFHHTRARYLRVRAAHAETDELAKEWYEDACGELNEAVEREDAGAADYHRRVAVYLAERQRLDGDRSLRETRRAIEKDLNALGAEIEERVRTAQVEGEEKLGKRLEALGRQTEERVRSAELRLVEAITIVTAALALIFQTTQETRSARVRGTWQSLGLIAGLGGVLLVVIIGVFVLLRWRGRRESSGQNPEEAGITPERTWP